MNKTLVLTENFPPVEGGSGRWFWELYSRLPGSQVVVATNNATQHIAPPANGMVIERLPLQSAEWGIKSVTGLTFYAKSVARIIKLIKKRSATMDDNFELQACYITTCFTITGI